MGDEAESVFCEASCIAAAGALPSRDPAGVVPTQSCRVNNMPNESDHMIHMIYDRNSIRPPGQSETASGAC